MSTLDIHSDSLSISTQLSKYYIPELITPVQVISLLNAVGIRFVLLGTHGLGGWMREPRATQDVDVLVPARGVRKAVRELLAAFPQLEAEDHEVVARLRNRQTQKVAIDVLKPNQDLLRAALKNTRDAEIEGQTYRIPSLEMALTLRFASMTRLTWADAKKHLDAADFIRMIEANADIDLAKLAELGALVSTGGGAEVVKLAEQVRRGENLFFSKGRIHSHG